MSKMWFSTFKSIGLMRHIHITMTKLKGQSRFFFNEIAFELELEGPIERIWPLTDTFG